jgi:hypothetical protein
MGYSLHVTVPVTPSNDFTSENMKWMPRRGVPVLLHITQFHLLSPSMPHARVNRAAFLA